MVKKIFVFAVVLTFLIGSTAFASTYSGKKVLFIDSYHAGYPWSDGIVKGVEDTLRGTGAELQIYRMDTKRNTDEAFKIQAAAKAKEVIDSWKPDVVIAADDNASKYLIVPYYKNSSIPFVFCGLNWDASNYGFPLPNVTGMVEVALIQQVIDNLKGHAKGSRVGYLTSDVMTEHKEAEYYGKLLNIHFAAERYVKNMAEWKQAFVEIQNQVDLLIVGNNSGINDWNDEEAAAWAMANTKVPTGTTYDWMVPVSMLGLTKVPEEQGIWSTKAALQILDGKSAGSIPVVKNELGGVFLNVKLASTAGVVFKPALLKNATVIK